MFDLNAIKCYKHVGVDTPLPVNKSRWRCPSESLLMEAYKSTELKVGVYGSTGNIEKVFTLLLQSKQEEY